jgi:DNA/RNA-binding domain of Phe-tRNA-synthetase-like protein
MIHVQSELARAWPRVEVFWLAARGLRGATRLREVGAARLAEAGDGLRHALPTFEALEAQEVVAQWREAYGGTGGRASSRRCSFEALARRVIAGRPVAVGVSAVDLYNACSLRHMACMGAYDAGRLGPCPLELRFCRPGTDTFEPLGGRPHDFPLCPKLVVYGQGDQVLCWGFNGRDSARTCLDAASDEAVFISEGVSEPQARNAREAMASLGAELAALGVAVTAVFSTKDAHAPAGGH